MTQRVPTFVKSPYIGLFQYPTAGPKRIHFNPNLTLLPSNIPYIGTFRHNVPFFIPPFPFSFPPTVTTMDQATQTRTTDVRHKQTQTTLPDLDSFIIVNYQDDRVHNSEPNSEPVV
jgi:hypothetical protein